MMERSEESTNAERGEGSEIPSCPHDLVSSTTRIPRLRKSGNEEKEPLDGSKEKGSNENRNMQDDESDDDEDSKNPECAVCLQPCIHPVELPCTHIFCFLCVKGVANRSKRCALCRSEIPVNFFNNPNLIRQEDLTVSQNLSFDEGYQWFYEGRNGWWQYDDRTGVDLEARYKAGDKLFELLIAGFLYVIDLDNFVQFRRSDRSRCRRMKRDQPTLQEVKGVAGIKYSSPPIADRQGADGVDTRQSSSNQTVVASLPLPLDSNQNTDDHFLTPSTPNNTPLTSQTPADSPPSSVSSSNPDLAAHLQQLSLEDKSPPLSRMSTRGSNHRFDHRVDPVSSSSSESDED